MTIMKRICSHINGAGLRRLTVVSFRNRTTDSSIYAKGGLYKDTASLPEAQSVAKKDDAKKLMSETAELDVSSTSSDLARRRNFTFNLAKNSQANRPVAVQMPKKMRKKESLEESCFADIRTVMARAGSGGNGIKSFMRLKNNPFAGPEGGDGGHGGHVIFQATPTVTTLAGLQQLHVGKHGEDGRTKHRHGKRGKDTIIEVPVGTLFKLKETGETVKDLKAAGQLFIGARGGAGGHGNLHYLSNQERAPTTYEDGSCGEEIEYIVELKTIADIGMVGFPNAGKSTLLRQLSRARPQIDTYAFTTLTPHVGHVQFDDHVQFSVADIPGIVPMGNEPMEKQNFGLGTDFLRHISRCHCICYVLDLSFADPWQQLRSLKAELETYEPGLSERRHIIVGNKIDLALSVDSLRRLTNQSQHPVYPISAKHRHGVDGLISAMRRLHAEHEEETLRIEAGKDKEDAADGDDKWRFSDDIVIVDNGNWK